MKIFECPVIDYSVCSFYRNTVYISHCACRAALARLPSAECPHKPGNIVLKHSFFIISILSDKYLGKFVCHT